MTVIQTNKKNAKAHKERRFNAIKETNENYLMNNIVQLKTQDKITTKTKNNEPNEDLKALARHLGRMAAKEYFESNQGNESNCDKLATSSVDSACKTGV